MSTRSSFFFAGFWAIPSLVQTALFETIATGILGGVVAARVADAAGWNGSAALAPLSWTLAVWFAVGAFFMGLTLRDIWRPGVTRQSYSPVHKFGPVMFTFGKDPAGYRYSFLGSHPAYVLMDLVAAAIPAALTAYSWGDDPLRNPTMAVHHWWLAIWVFVPAARLFCWYGLGRGPNVLRTMGLAAKPGVPAAAAAEYFWGGPVLFWAVALLFTVPAVLLGIRDGRRYDKGIPALTGQVIRAIYGVHHDPDAPASLPNHDDERFRITGTLRGPVRHWPGGGGKLDGLGFVVALEDGAEAAVFADEADAKALERKDGQPITALVRTLQDGGKAISAHYAGLYNWSEADLAPVPEAASRNAGAARRILTRYVDP